MKTNWNKEEVNGLLDGLLKQYYSYKPWKFNTSTLNEYKKDNGLLPTLEVNRWYKGERGEIAELTDFEMKAMGVWGNSIVLQSPQYWREATHEEVETALKAEAKKLKGKTLQNIYNSSKSFTFDDSFLIEYNRTDNRVYIRNSNYRDVYDLMNNGKWAEIITKPEVNEFTIKELEELTGKTNIKIIK